MVGGEGTLGETWLERIVSGFHFDWRVGVFPPKEHLRHKTFG